MLYKLVTITLLRSLRVGNQNSQCSIYIYACIYKLYVRPTELFLIIISITQLLALWVLFFMDG